MYFLNIYSGQRLHCCDNKCHLKHKTKTNLVKQNLRNISDPQQLLKTAELIWYTRPVCLLPTCAPHCRKKKEKKTTTVRRAALPTVDQSYCTCSPFKPIAEGQCSESSQSLWARITDATEMQQTEQNNKLHCKSNSFTPKQYEAKGEKTMVKSPRKKKKKIRPPMYIRDAFRTDKAFREHHFFLKGRFTTLSSGSGDTPRPSNTKTFSTNTDFAPIVAKISILKDVLAYNGISLDCSSSMLCFWDE